MVNRPGELQTLEPFGPEPTFDAAEEPVSFGDSLIASAARENLTGSIYTASQREAPVSAGVFTPDPDFNPFRYLEENSDRYGDLAPLAFGEEQERFFDITSAEEFEHLAPFMMEELGRIQRAEAGGFVPQLIGGVASVAFDPVSWIGGAGLGKVYQAWRTGSRLGNVSKNALLGSTAAGLHETVAHLTQDFRTPEESMMAIGMGGAFGGILGGILKPSGLRGEPHAHRRIPQTVEEVDGHHLSPNTADEGAQVIPGDPESQATAWDDSVGASRAVGGDFLPGSRSTTPLDFTSPLGRSIKRSADFVKRFAGLRGAEGQEHVGTAARAYEQHSEILEKLLDTHIVTQGTEAGVAKGRNAETISKRLKGIQVDRTAQMQQVHNRMLVDIYKQEGFLTREFRPKISRLQFENEVRTFRLMRDKAFQGADYRPSESLPLTSGQKEEFIKFVEEANRIESDYYDHFSKLMVDNGLLEADEVLENYLPQAYNRDAIAADPVAFKRKLRQLFMRDADDEWMKANGFLTEDQTFASLSKSDPDAAAEAFAEWQASNAQALRVTADQEYQVAGHALGLADEALTAATRQARKARTILARKKIREIQVEQRNKAVELSAARARRDRMAAERQAVVEAATAARQQTLSRQQTLAPEGAQPAIEAVPANVRQQAVAREAAKRLRAQDARVRQLEGEVNGIGKRLRQAEKAVEEAEALRLAADRAVKAAQEQRKSAGARQRAAERAVRQADQAAARSLEEQVDAVFKAITDSQQTPFGLLPQDVVGASGRIKRRQLNWGTMILDEDLRPFLNTEPERLSLLFSEDISPRIALRRVFGSEDLEPELTGLAERFNEAEVAARNAGDEKLAAKVVRDRQSAQRDLTALRDRVLGRFRLPDNPNSAVLWGSRKLREFNFLRLMGKVMLSSITDLATGSLATQSGFRFLPRMVRNHAKLLKKIPSHEIRALLIGYENSVYYARTVRNFGLDDAAAVERGIGSGGVRRFTGKLDVLAETGVHRMNQLNGMQWWNKRTRVMFGTILMDNMRRDFADFANLPARKRNMYLRRQIDEDMARRIAGHFERSGDEVDGVVFPNAERMLQEDPQAYNAMVETITSVLDEALIVPGAGDLPLLMSGPMGQVILQFQSFAFATVNRYLRPGMQQRDAYAAMNMVMGVGLGGLAYSSRMVLNGQSGIERLEDQIENSPQDLFYEAFTRSPVIGPAPLPLDMMTRLVGRAGNERLADLGLPKLFPNVSRFQERSGFLIPFGPSIGAAETLWDFASSGANLALDPSADTADAERFLRKGVRLTPFSNLGWVTGTMNAVDAPGFRPVPKE